MVLHEFSTFHAKQSPAYTLPLLSVRNYFHHRMVSHGFLILHAKRGLSPFFPYFQGKVISIIVRYHVGLQLYTRSEVPTCFRDETISISYGTTWVCSEVYLLSSSCFEGYFHCCTVLHRFAALHAKRGPPPTSSLLLGKLLSSSYSTTWICNFLLFLRMALSFCK